MMRNVVIALLAVSAAAAIVKKDPVEDAVDEKALQAEIGSLQHVSTDISDREATLTKEKTSVKAPAKEELPVDKKEDLDVEKLHDQVAASPAFQKKVQVSCEHSDEMKACEHKATEALFCQLLHRSKPESAERFCNSAAPALVQKPKLSLVQLDMQRRLRKTYAPEDDLAKEMTHDLEMNFNKIAPFGKEDTAKELQDHAAKTQDTLVDAVENAEVAEIKRAVFRALTRLRAATIKEFDTIARLETQAIDAYNDAHHYRAENPLTHLHEDEAPVETDKLKSFH